MSFLGFALPILFPSPSEEGVGVRDQLCGCFVTGQGQPTTMIYMHLGIKYLCQHWKSYFDYSAQWSGSKRWMCFNKPFHPDISGRPDEMVFLRYACSLINRSEQDGLITIACIQVFTHQVNLGQLASQLSKPVSLYHPKATLSYIPLWY